MTKFGVLLISLSSVVSAHAANIVTTFDLGGANASIEANQGTIDQTTLFHIQTLSHTLDFTGDGTNDTLTVSTVPEPSSYALLAGLLGLSCVMVRRRRA
ncbi:MULTISPECIES: PEP-CTERM sorting domain-containing protein [unclassified Lentimonas]|uniref:PEP-CTERM sorting domain-containing protein n=1 Tax=unclassified Lentimonas TaxID=2630993 RepID=UPI00132A4763|nr:MULTISPECIES: PEP-CTERM sorting domain-containing protein [unclassified Lentimonas]CAA6691735.1 Unannotated [Lentimonas sp. CC19]CAA6696094.1 Unannotated [Lentimonas sp. CC10]CAA7070086.1 Unannotated [Lentimonas sp. CC11]